MSELPWVEKYRPKKIDDIIGQEEAVTSAKVFVKRRDMPHLLYVGPPGVGKTTLADCLAREKRARVLELNASDERKIAVVRDRIKKFCRMSLRDEIKIVILDEMEEMTTNAQTALRRIMEQYSRITRFILCVNNVDKVIPALKSRCSRFDFKNLTKEEVKQYLSRICNHEKLDVELDDKFVAELIDVYRGDLRLITNTFQAIVQSEMSLTPETISKLAGKPSFDIVKQLIKLALDGHFANAWVVAEHQIFRHGLTARGVLETLHKHLFELVDKERQIEVAKELGKWESNINIYAEVDSDKIQLQAFLARLASLGEVK